MTILLDPDANSASAGLALFRESLRKIKALPAEEAQRLYKATFAQSGSATTGLTAYSLEAPAKTFIPRPTPLRNRIPRRVGGMGIQANWRAVTAVDTDDVFGGVTEGNRGVFQSVQIKEYFAAFRGIGGEANATFEAVYSGEGFDDVKARSVQANLIALMRKEEKIILGGLGTYGLGVSPTPSLATDTTGGSITANANVFVRVVALSLQGYVYAARTASVRGLFSIITANGKTENRHGGTARASASATLAVGASGNAHKVTASCVAVPGACGYAWFVGSTDGAAANLKLAAVTSVNTTVIKAIPAGAEQVLPTDLVSNDRSQDSTIFNGFLSLIAQSDSSALWKVQETVAGAGKPLTSDGAGGIIEFDEVLEWFYTNHKMSPSEIWVSAQEGNAIRKHVLEGKATAAQRFTFASMQQGIVGGGVVKGYLNPFVMDGMVNEIPIAIHPDLPPGTVLFLTHELPYPVSEVTDVNRMMLRRDYYQLEWPLTSRQHEYGIYFDGVLQTYFPPANAVLTNIGKIS
jgi:hypothetical protein